MALHTIADAQIFTFLSSRARYKGACDLCGYPCSSLDMGEDVQERSGRYESQRASQADNAPIARWYASPLLPSYFQYPTLTRLMTQGPFILCASLSQRIVQCAETSCVNSTLLALNMLAFVMWSSATVSLLIQPHGKSNKHPS